MGSTLQLAASSCKKRMRSSSKFAMKASSLLAPWSLCSKLPASSTYTFCDACACMSCSANNSAICT